MRRAVGGVLALAALVCLHSAVCWSATRAEMSPPVINYAGDSGIFLDRCDSCGGLWLDYLELEKVQALLEQWADESPDQIKALAGQLEAAGQEMYEQTRFNFRSSRFSFVNAILSRLLDAA